MKLIKMRIHLYTYFIISLLGCVNTQAQISNQSAIKCPGGVNVNSYNGNMNLSRTDLFIKGRKLNFNMTFYYNSFECRKNLGYGNGWQFQYLRQYVPDSTGIKIISSDGRVDHFTGDTITNIYNAPKGVFDSLVLNSPGSYVLITKSKMKYFFENPQHKRLTRIEEANGNFLNFSYTDSLLTQISDGAGRSLQLSYANGKLSQITDANGAPLRTIKYNYDSNGNLIQVTDPAGNKTKYTSIINGPINTITDKNGNTVDVIYSSNFSVKEVISCLTDQRFTFNNLTHTSHIVEAVESGNQVTIIQYDTNGNVIKKTGNCCGFNVSYEYNNKNKVSKFTNANGDSFEYTYDANGNLLTNKDPYGKSYIYTYDPIYSRLLSYTDKNGNTTSFTYDSKGNLTQAAFPLNVNNFYTYAANGDMISSTDGNGNTTTFNYDNYGNCNAIHRPLGVNHSFVYNSKSQLISYVDPNGNTSEFQLDTLERIISVLDPMNNQLSMTYDAIGNLKSIIDKNNHTTTFHYDALNRLTEYNNALNHSWYLSYDAKSNLLVSTNPNGHKFKYTYDNLNRVISKTSPTNDVLTFSYDGVGNIISSALPNGNSINITYDKLRRTTQISDDIGIICTYNYDNENNILGVTDGMGNSKNFTYDALNRIISRTDPFGNSTLKVFDNNFNIISFKNYNNQVKTFSYDALNRRTHINGPQGSIADLEYDLAGNLIHLTDANNHSTTYDYDALNRISQVSFADATSNILNYDAAGNVIGITDANGAITNYIYDATNKLIKKDYVGNNDDVYTFDAAGRMITAVNNDAIVSFNFDASNKLLAETLNGKTTSYLYDVSGNKHSTTYPSGRVISRTYDHRNRLTEVKEENNPLSSYSYDNANRVLRININANNTLTDYSFDGKNRLVSMQTNPATIFNSSFGYDKMGNKLYEKKLHRIDQSEQYSYDNVMRLTSFKSGILTGNNISSPVHQSQYTYDNQGNRTTVTLDTQTTTYTSNNMNAYISLSGAVNSTFQYDNKGNLINDGTNSYTYDAENKLIAVNNGITAVYKYDAIGRRIYKQAGSTKTEYYYSAYNEIENRDSLSNLRSSYVYGSRVDDIITARINNKNIYYYKNTLGSVNAIADSVGTIIERYEYDPFGKTHFYNANYNPIVSSSIGNNILFAGRSYDLEIEKYFNRARHYNENTGRFEQRDPKGYFAGDLNLYSYVFNNPTGIIDPFGTDGTHCGQPGSSPDALAIGGDLILTPADLAFQQAAKMAGSRESQVIEEFFEHINNNPNSTGGFVEEFLKSNMKDGIATSAKLSGISKAIGTAGGILGPFLAGWSAMGSASTLSEDPTNGHILDHAIASAGFASASIGLVSLAFKAGIYFDVIAGGVAVDIAAAAGLPIVGGAALALAVTGIANSATQYATGHTLGEHLDDGFNAWFDWYFMDLDDDSYNYVPNHCN